MSAGKDAYALRRYVVIGANNELWCSGCGSVIYDEEIHEDWHQRLEAVDRAARPGLNWQGGPR